MSSTFNIFVMEYFDLISTIVINEPDKYTDVISDINQCLEKHGWSNGFRSEPNQSALVKDLEIIVDKYF